MPGGARWCRSEWCAEGDVLLQSAWWEGSRGSGSEEQPNKQAQDQHQCTTTTTTTTEEEEVRHSHSQPASQYVLAEASAAQVYQCEWCGVEGYLYQLESSAQLSDLN
jgi:hypothetical protein